MPNGLYQTPDLKKLEYKKYLEKTGVNDALTKVLVGLYEEPDRPSNAIDYIKKYLGASSNMGMGMGMGMGGVVGSNEYEKVKKENHDLKSKVKELEHCIGDLRRKIMRDEEEREEQQHQQQHANHHHSATTTTATTSTHHKHSSSSASRTSRGGHGLHGEPGSAGANSEI